MKAYLQYRTDGLISVIKCRGGKVLAVVTAEAAEEISTPATGRNINREGGYLTSPATNSAK